MSWAEEQKLSKVVANGRLMMYCILHNNSRVQISLSGMRDQGVPEDASIGDCVLPLHRDAVFQRDVRRVSAAIVLLDLPLGITAMNLEMERLSSTMMRHIQSTLFSTTPFQICQFDLLSGVLCAVSY